VQDVVVKSGSSISYGMEPKSCLGRVFNSRLVRFAIRDHECMSHIQQEIQTDG
jgi:hypothetical protein